MQHNHVRELAKDICAPVLHCMEKSEYDMWLQAVENRLLKEFGLMERLYKHTCDNIGIPIPLANELEKVFDTTK
jgi:tRNA A-37 threonylcarbamoyl transferase component Bud32